MDEAAEQVAAGYPKSLRRRVRTDGWANARVGRLEVERAVGSLLVVVPDVDAEDMLELASGGIFCVLYPDRPFTREVQRVARQVLGDAPGGSPP